MLADRAELGRLRANDRMTAVAALPHGDATLFKDLHGLHILQQCAAALLVRLFDGGMEPIPGAMIGGFAIGLLEALVSAVGLSIWKDGVVFAILIVVLLVKPTGILGRPQTEKV